MPILFAAAMIICLSGCDKGTGGLEPGAAKGQSTVGGGGGASSSGNHELQLADTAAVVGAQTELTLKVIPKGGFKVNKDFPWRATIEPTDGVDVPKGELGSDKWKLDDKEGTLSFPITVKTPGDKTVAGKVSFAVCIDDRCELIRDKKVSWKVTAKTK